MTMNARRKVLCVFLAAALSGCGVRAPTGTVTSADAEPPEKLSAYRLFHGDGSTQEPVAGVIPYDINTPLFSDYTAKYRFVRLPPLTSAQYHETDVFEFPVGTILVKTFAYLNELSDPSKGRQLIETRLLVHKPEGWVGLPYIWNDEQTEATLQIAGGTRDFSWRDSDGHIRTNNYIIPNVNQCLGCHENNKVLRPIGPKARNLNRDFAYPEGSQNQLVHWTNVGYLKGAPAPDLAARMPVWNDPSTGTLEERAKAWLEINCAHCHNPAGPAKTSGLDLVAEQTDLYKRGFWKMPIAAGPGSGGRSYDIVPGRPEESILLYRIQSTDPRVMMPQLGHRLVDEEGVGLVRDWIASLTPVQK
jgi:uncharacterized repeat protein (TIGR03806 family)